MSETVTLGIFVAFSAGLLSFLSPCVLPLVPSYIGFLTGMTAPDAANRRRVTVTHAVFFVLGFTAVFLALGALGFLPPGFSQLLAEAYVVVRLAATGILVRRISGDASRLSSGPWRGCSSRSARSRARRSRRSGTSSPA